jgi:hypothetical protein
LPIMDVETKNRFSRRSCSAQGTSKAALVVLKPGEHSSRYTPSAMSTGLRAAKPNTIPEATQQAKVANTTWAGRTLALRIRCFWKHNADVNHTCPSSGCDLVGCFMLWSVTSRAHTRFYRSESSAAQTSAVWICGSLLISQLTPSARDRTNQTVSSGPIYSPFPLCSFSEQKGKGSNHFRGLLNNVTGEVI